MRSGESLYVLPCGRFRFGLGWLGLPPKTSLCRVVKAHWLLPVSDTRVRFGLLELQVIFHAWAAYFRVGRALLSLRFLSTMRLYHKLVTRDTNILRSAPLERQVLSFQFKMPKDPTEMTKLMEMVPRYIDLVGRSTLSAKAKDKATKNREATKAEAFRDTLNERQLAFQRKKARRWQEC